MIGRLDVRDMKKKINNKGFTLIELLAIIAITAIVLGVGTYGIVNLVERSNEKASLISETSIKESASLYADEAGDSLWIDPGSGDYKYYCVTIDELINKGLIKKNAKLPRGIDKYNYVSIKKNKVTFVKGESLIIKDALDGSADASVCVGNIIKEKIESAPKEKNVTSYTDEIDSVFDDLVGESKIIDKTCYFNKDSSSIVRDDEHKGIFDKSSNTCLIKGLDDETIYYYKTCMTTEKGSIICSNSYSTSTASFVSPEFSMKDDTITIKYKDDNVKEPYHYFKSNVDGTSDKNVSECTLGSDNKFTCSGSTSNITKDKWYKVNENEVKITYKDNEIKNGDITARIMDGTGNYKDNDKKFNLYRIVFKKGNADKINNGTNDITNICLNDIDKKCNIKSPSISKDGYTIVGWNTDSSASSSIWKANTSKDIDGSNTYYPIIKSRVNIKLNANGGSVTKETSKGGTYTTDSSGIISRNGKNIFHTINYGEKMNSSGLANYNNKDYLYITKNGSIVTKNKEWICLSGCTTSGKVYSQYEAYSSDDFCDAKENNCTVVLGVNWKKDSYTISYNANGGSGSMTSDTVSIGDTVTIKNNTFTKTGYTFTGWTTKSDGTDDGYGWTGWSGTWNYDNGQYGINNNKLVLYARWTSNKYTISYNANGGSNAPSNQSKIENKSISLSSSKPTKTGYTFVNWNTKKDGSGTSYSAGATYSNNANVTLYAQWRINKVYIKLDANGGSVRGSTTYGSCRTNNNLIGCSWNSPKELFHTIDYGDSLDSAGLANYNNPEYLYITRDNYFVYSSDVWICDSSSGCSTVGRTFDQDTAYKASDFCDASNGDCTVTLKVNWKKIDTTINDWRCQGIYSYFITYCDSDDMCEYTAVAYKENRESYFKHVVGKIDRTTLNNSSCFLDSINDYRCNSNGKYKITTCSETTCNYTEFNGSSASGTVDRDTLRNCITQEHTHVWKARGIRKFAIGQSTQFTCGSYHNYGFAVYCSICGMSKDYYNSHVAKVGEKFVCPDYPYGTPSGWKIYDDCAITTRSSLQNISGDNSFDETTKNSC